MENTKTTDYRFKILYAVGMILVVSGHVTLSGGISLFNNWFSPYSYHLALFVDILVQRNLDSGDLETGIPDAGNRLNSAWVICAWIVFVCQAPAASAVRSRLYKQRLSRQTTWRRIEMVKKRFPVTGQAV